MDYIYYYLNIKDDMLYVGQSNNIIRRDKEHKSGIARTYFDNEYHAHPNDFILDYIECDKKLKNYLELYYIFWFQSKIPNGYNCNDGGNYIPQSEETNDKISASLIEYYKVNGVSQNTKNKISNTLTGTYRPEEVKKKILASHKKTMVRCKKTNTIYESIMEAERLTGISHGNISKCCRGIYGYKTAGGSEWEFVAP